MAIRTKEELKERFKLGDRPTQQDFIDLIDSLEDRLVLEAHMSNSIDAHGITILVQAIAEKATKTELAALVDSSPELLNTFNEFAIALGNDPNFATTILGMLAVRYTKEESDARYLAIGESMPTGAIIRSGPITPEGFYACTGALANKVIDAKLYNVIGDSNAYLSYRYNNGCPWYNQYDSNDTIYVAPSWTTSSIVLPEVLTKSAVFITNGYAYLVGGKVSSTHKNTVYRASINQDGTLNSFELVDTLPVALSGGLPVVIKNYIYIFNSLVNGTASKDIYRATIYEDGTITSFSLYGQIHAVYQGGSAVVTTNRIYLLGMDSTQYSATAVINSDGSLGTWGGGINTSAATVWGGHIFKTKNHVYFIGGNTASTVLVSSINSDGTLSAWTSLGALVSTSGGGSVVITNNAVLLVKNSTTTFIRLNIGDDGTIVSSLSETNAFPISISSIAGSKSIITSSKVYVLGHGTTAIYQSEFIGGANNYLQIAYNAPELQDNFFLPDLRIEDSFYPNNSVRHYIKR